MLNIVALMGRLTADPELKQTGQGTSVTAFRVACERNYARQGEQRQADFITVVAWRQQAEFVCKYFRKGSLIALNGRLQTRQYQDRDGNNRTAVEVVAEQLNFAGGKNEQPGGKQPAPARSAAPQPAPSFSTGSADEFAVIDDEEDLPF